VKASVIIRCRNEYPIVLGTVLCLLNDLEHCGITPEIIVVDNNSDDNTADVLLDRFRRWVRSTLSW
jgi:glycosyltransferase involved in cell wall biosynthesis